MKLEHKGNIVLAGCLLLAAAGAGNAADSIASKRPASTSAYADAIARAQQKLGAAQQLVASFADRASAEKLGDGWRVEMLNALMRGSSNDWAQIAASASAREALDLASRSAASGMPQALNGTLHNAASASVTPDSIGTDHYDLTYIPIYASCRLVDTRQSGGGGPIANNTARKFSVSSYSSQGGSCDPFGAYYGINHNPPAALAINVTIDSRGLSAPANSYLQVYPDGTTPVTSWMNYGGSNDVLANAGILQISPSNLYFDITAQAQTNVIVDVVGAFVPPNPTPLACTQVSNSATNSNGAGFSITSPTCTSGYTVTGGSCYSSPGGLTGATRLVSSYQNGNAWTCEFYGNTVNNYADATATCCKVPGGPSTP